MLEAKDREPWFALAYQDGAAARKIEHERIEDAESSNGTEGAGSEGGGQKADTVTLKHLAASLAEKRSVPKSQMTSILTGMVESVGKHLKKGARIRIPGLGILQVRKREARMGRNPATGEAIKIKASKKIAFRASKDLKEAVI